mgnify:CR=1 FL=1
MAMIEEVEDINAEGLARKTVERDIDALAVVIIKKPTDVCFAGVLVIVDLGSEAAACKGETCAPVFLLVEREQLVHIGHILQAHSHKLHTQADRKSVVSTCRDGQIASCRVA